MSSGWDDISRAFGGKNDWMQSLPSSYGPYYSPENDPRRQNLLLSYGYGTPLLQQLQQAAAGQGPSQAQNLLREGTANTVASQYGAAATPSVGGAQQAALLANAQNNAAAAMQSGARQAAQLRAQEMSDARQQMSQALQGQQQVNTQAAGQELQQRLGNIQGNVGIEALNQKTGQENRGGGLGTVLSAVGSLFSDIRAKEDIQPMAPTAFAPTVGSVGAGYGAVGINPTGTPVSASYLPPPDTSGTGGGAQFPNYYQPPKQDSGGGSDGGGIGGFLSMLSDERSKERIRSLEGALAESRRTADAIGGANGLGALSESDRELMTRLYPQSAAAGRAAGYALTPEATRRMRDDVAQGILNQRGLGAISEADRELMAPLGGGPPTARFADLATPQGSRAALAPVAPYEYRYKPEFAARTGDDTAPRAGVMAQDLERSPNPALRSAVVPTPMGLAIDGKRALSANLALSAGLDKRLRNLEDRTSILYGGPNYGDFYGATEGLMAENPNPTAREIGDSRQFVIDDLMRQGARPEAEPTLEDFSRRETNARVGIGRTNRAANQIRNTPILYPNLAR